MQGSSKAFEKIDIGGCLSSQTPPNITIAAVGKLIQIGFEFAPST